MLHQDTLFGLTVSCSSYILTAIFQRKSSGYTTYISQRKYHKTDYLRLDYRLIWHLIYKLNWTKDGLTSTSRFIRLSFCVRIQRRISARLKCVNSKLGNLQLLRFLRFDFIKVRQTTSHRHRQGCCLRHMMDGREWSVVDAPVASLSPTTPRGERDAACSWIRRFSVLGQHIWGGKKKGLKHDDWSAAFLTLYQVTALQEGPLGSHSEHLHWIKSVKPFSLYDFPLIYYIWWMQHFITSMWWSCVDVALGHRLWQPDGLLFWLSMNQLPNVCV